MKWVFRVLRLMTALSAATCFAQTESDPGQVGIDCWIGYESSQIVIHYIRCIPDRDLPHPRLADSSLDAVLEDLHSVLHQMSGADAERLYKGKIELVRETASVWSIRIFSYPPEWSWEEGRPQRLVRALLCPKDTSCRVSVHPR